MISFYELKAQNDLEKGFSIKQVILPGGDFSEYLYENGILTIKNNGNKIFRTKLDSKIYIKLDSLIQILDLEKIDSIYQGGGIDGVNWTFTFKGYSSKEKQIYFNNYFQNDFHKVLLFINSQIPEKKRYISFEYGFFTNIHSKSDTLEIVLPDFYLEKVDLPEYYTSYRIMCFKKHYCVSENIDSIQVCDCRIYPKKTNNNKKTRNLWRYTKLENGKWKKEFYDDEGKIIKMYYVQDILPYDFVKIKTFVNKGDRPSVKIIKYYRTKHIKKE